MSPAKKKAAVPKPVESVEHKDKRLNIPTGQQSHLVEPAEEITATVRYPRDPSLDPQLVWKGKDELDGEDLVVPAAPIYIQEKIDPRAIIENLRTTAVPDELEPELTLFDDFDGLDDLDPIEKIDFYQHEGNWQNRMILGDSLVVMASLAEKENLRGKVQMIYMDPPYGIKFGSNWQVSTRKRDVRDGKVEDAAREPEVVKAFRDTWELGIHSYLTYLRDRLAVARDLLTDTGSAFVQIGSENVHLVRAVMDEVFGAENFASLISFKTTSGAGSFAGGTNVLASVNNYLVWYARDLEHVKYRQLFKEKSFGGEGAGQYTWIEDKDAGRRRMTSDERSRGATEDRVFRPDQFTSQTTRVGQTTVFPVSLGDQEYLPSKGGWKTNREGVERLKVADRLLGVGRTLTYVRYLDDFPAFPLNNLWDDTTTSGFADPKIYVVQTNSKVIERCIQMTTDPGDLVLDPTCGAGTSAFVAEQWGRRWITADTSRVALGLARTRLMSARYTYYLLADSDAGIAKEAEVGGQAMRNGSPGHDIRQGFVCRRVPHITLKSIAQNPDIKPGMTRADLEAAVIQHGDSEVLVDQPYTDSKRVRVAGRFTVESLSPHRMLDEGPHEASLVADPDEVQFETMILDNLRTAGVQNSYKGEKLSFDRLEPQDGGEWIQADGEYTEDDGTSRRVAVAVGSEFGTVGSEQVALAAQEATRGIPYDVLLVTGFAFDANAWAKAKEISPDVAERSLGRLQVLLVRANPDLAMGDELLKKTGAGNLFMVFGEPDIEINCADGEVTVEVRGLDVYDPTTGKVRSASTDDIAAWFIDTNYDGTSFFVRHAYFTGGQKPYESLAKTLRAEIDADAWASLYSTTSRPFPTPETGRIAVKVINHYGDEVMQVYGVEWTVEGSGQ